MKNHPAFISFFLFLCSLYCPLWISGQILSPEVPHIEVTGQGQTEAEPELLRWDLQVENRGPDIAELAETHTEAVARTLRAIQKLGVKMDHIQTSRPKLDEHYTRKNNSNVKDGYIASTRINFELTEIGKYHQVWLELSKLEGLRIHNSTWGLDRDSLGKLQSAARLGAIANAREKAVKLAKALHMKVLNPLKITEPGNQHYRPSADTFALSEAIRSHSSGPAYSAGTLVINAKVNVVFEMQAIHP